LSIIRTPRCPVSYEIAREPSKSTSSNTNEDEIAKDKYKEKEIEEYQNGGERAISHLNPLRVFLQLLASFSSLPVASEYQVKQKPGDKSQDEIEDNVLKIQKGEIPHDSSYV
jgi:hypothetical protein